MTPPTTLPGSGAAPVAQRAEAGRIERWVVAGLLVLVMLAVAANNSDSTCSSGAFKRYPIMIARGLASSIKDDLIMPIVSEMAGRFFRL